MLGLNLFGPMNTMNLPREELFTCVANMGYSEIEPCVSLIGAGHPAFFLPQELKALLPLAAKLGLKCTCAHVNTGELLPALPTMLTFVKECGMKTIVLWAPSGLENEAYCQKVDNYCTVAKALAEVNCELLLHNGWPDIVEKRDGKTIYEWVIEGCSGAVGMQFDVGWCQFGKEDPIAFALRNKDKIRSIHLKDVRGNYETTDPDFSNVGMGQGEVDIRAFSRMATAYGVAQLVDQDRSDASMQADLASAVKLLG